jgi:hypothetical protein
MGKSTAGLFTLAVCFALSGCGETRVEVKPPTSPAQPVVIENQPVVIEKQPVVVERPVIERPVERPVAEKPVVIIKP